MAMIASYGETPFYANSMPDPQKFALLADESLPFRREKQKTDAEVADGLVSPDGETIPHTLISDPSYDLTNRDMH
jgi:hypothetical protein